jgi:uncharacterized membrane protein
MGDLLYRLCDTRHERYFRIIGRKVLKYAYEMLMLSFLIGLIDGLRSMTAPAAVAWAARLGWLNLRDTPFAFLASTVAVVVFTVFALGEFVADQLPSTPPRTEPAGLIARVVMGGFCGACLAASGKQSLVVGACLGAVGAVIGAFAGYQARTRSVKDLGVRDLFVALTEDALAIGGALLIVQS